MGCVRVCVFVFVCIVVCTNGKYRKMGVKQGRLVTQTKCFDVQVGQADAFLYGGATPSHTD